MAQESAAEAQNKQIVLEFYEKVLNGKNAEAVASYFGSHYTPHNPGAADGIEGFRKFIAYLRQNYPQAHSEPKHVFAGGNYVIIHSQAIREPRTRGVAVVDVFRLEDRKIVEHWDIIQPVPETAATAMECFDGCTLRLEKPTSPSRRASGQPSQLLEQLQCRRGQYPLSAFEGRKRPGTLAPRDVQGVHQASAAFGIVDRFWHPAEEARVSDQALQDDNRPGLDNDVGQRETMRAKHLLHVLVGSSPSWRDRPLLLHRIFQRQLSLAAQRMAGGGDHMALILPAAIGDSLDLIRW